jgi:hypothetical protein
MIPSGIIPSVMFPLMWDTLADVPGRAATGDLLRRAARRASAFHEVVKGLLPRWSDTVLLRRAALRLA